MGQTRIELLYFPYFSICKLVAGIKEESINVWNKSLFMVRLVMLCCLYSDLLIVKHVFCQDLVA